MNTYTVDFEVKCPNSEHGVIQYHLEIESSRMIMVESIDEAVKGFEDGFHEDIADALIKKLGGLQTMSATHHGVQIKTVRS